jgi:hypothetical protein
MGPVFAFLPEFLLITSGFVYIEKGMSLVAGVWRLASGRWLLASGRHGDQPYLYKQKKGHW